MAPMRSLSMPRSTLMASPPALTETASAFAPLHAEPGRQKLRELRALVDDRRRRNRGFTGRVRR